MRLENVCKDTVFFLMLQENGRFFMQMCCKTYS